MKGKKMVYQHKTLEELYTREQIRKIGEVNKTNRNFDWEYSPIVLRFFYGVEEVFIGGECRELCIHVKAQYMFLLWKSALEKTKEIYPNFLDHVWEKKGYFKFIHYTSLCHEEALRFFWKQLEIIANSESVLITESKTIDVNNNLMLVCQSFGSFSYAGKYYSDKARSYVCSNAVFTYTWNEVKEYFLELSAMEVSFLYGDEMNEYNVSSEPLFEACSKHDLDEIKRAVESGIDINSFDDMGNTPLCDVLSRCTEEGYEALCHNDSRRTEKVLKIMDYLLENGANINLYGFDGDDILTEAHFLGNLRIIEYLFQHGLNKNLNCLITDPTDNAWYVMNGAYDFVCMDLGIVGADTKKLLEQEKIMKKYGVQFFIEGWNQEKVDAYYRSVPTLE